MIELSDGYTILTKDGCKWCVKVKELLPDAKYIVCNIPGDASEEREAFFKEVDALSGTAPRTFPMVFYNKRFIGGYVQTKNKIDAELTFDSVYF